MKSQMNANRLYKTNLREARCSKQRKRRDLLTRITRATVLHHVKKVYLSKLLQVQSACGKQSVGYKLGREIYLPDGDRRWSLNPEKS